MKNTTYHIIEDDGGGLYLFVFDGDGDGDGNVIDGIENLEYAQPGEYNEVETGLKNDPLAEIAGWDGHMDDPAESYDQLTSYEYGWAIVCDNGSLYPDKMGAAANLYFFGDNDPLESLIGSHIESDKAKTADWDQHYPEIDEDGIITGIFSADQIPDDAVLVNWEDKPIITDGSAGFDAILA